MPSFRRPRCRRGILQGVCPEQGTFSVRLGEAKWVDPNAAVRVPRWREFLCHREGAPSAKTSTVKPRARLSFRCNCKAMLRVSLCTRAGSPDAGLWTVLKFEDDHSHELLTVEETAFLPANRNLTAEEEADIQLLRAAGLRGADVLKVQVLLIRILYNRRCSERIVTVNQDGLKKTCTTTSPRSAARGATLTRPTS